MCSIFICGFYSFQNTWEKILLRAVIVSIVLGYGLDDQGSRV